ncbi:MAG: SprT-like domain-containing protein [Vampirovibrionia bacterium]
MGYYEDLNLIKLFMELRSEYWNNSIPIINIYFHDQNFMGEYIFPRNSKEDFYDNYSIGIKKDLKTKQKIDTILHEMTHHYVFTNNKELVWSNKIYMHGKLWRQEMRRIGFTGKITKYS